MALTPTQLLAVKADILANPDLNSEPDTPDGAFTIASKYNTVVVPTFFVWRTAVPQTEIMLNGFDWTRVDNLSIGAARVWDWMFLTGSFNPSQPNIRAGIDAVWKGTAADLAVRVVVYGHCQRASTRLEKLLATGAGTTVVNGIGPALMGFEGAVSFNDILQARAS